MRCVHRLTAIVLAICLALSYSLVTLAQASSVSIPVDEIQTLAPSWSGSDRSALYNLPAALGTLEEIYDHPGSQKTILYIQDAHDSLEAQEHIAGLIDYFVTHHEIKTIFEEGYEGPVPTDQFFGVIKDATVRKKAA